MLKKHKRLTKKELKKDPLLIFTAQVIDFLRDEWIKIVSIILSVVFFVAISLYLVKSKSTSEMNSFDIATNAYNTNQPEAIDLLVTFAEKYRGSKYTEAVLMKLGNHYFSEKDYEPAEKYYMEYINKFSDNPIYGYNAYCGLGGIYEEQGDFLKAGEIYEEFTRKYKDSTFISLMYLNAGKAYFTAGDNDAAMNNFNNIINKYGDSFEKQEAVFYLEMIINESSGA
ncbi:tol-pal system YbgF family protein [Candidatus Latescibacterota bacterium]